MKEMAVRVKDGGWHFITWREAARIIIKAFEKTARARWYDLINNHRLYCRTEWRNRTTVVLDPMHYTEKNP